MNMQNTQPKLGDDTYIYIYIEKMRTYLFLINALDDEKE